MIELMKTRAGVLALVFSVFLCNCSVAKLGDFQEPCQFISEQRTSENQINKGEKLYPIFDDASWGFIDSKGNIKIEPQFRAVDEFAEGLAAFKSPIDGGWGYVNTDGDVAIEPIFNAASRFYEERAIVSVDGKRGYINTDGEYILRPLYDNALRFSEGRAFVLTGNSWRLIDKNGEFITENSFKQVNSFREGLASFVGFNNDYRMSGYIDTKGEIVFLMTDDFSVHIENAGFSNERATVSRLAPLSPARFLNFRWAKVYGAIDQSGQLVVPTKYDYISLYSECIAIVKRDQHYGAIDLDGNVVISLRYSYLAEFHEGLALAQKREGEKFGYINLKGEWILEPIQDIDYSYPLQSSFQLQDLPKSRNFYSDRALFRSSNGKYGYIDKTGKIIIEPTFDLAFPFEGELAKFENSSRVGYIDLDGDVVWSANKSGENW